MNERSISAPPIGHLAWREFFVGLRGVRGFAVSAFEALRCQPLFLVFGRLVIYRTVAKSRSESGYKIGGRRKHGRDFWARFKSG